MEQIEISREVSPGAKFVKYIGEPRITDHRYGHNAYGSILAEYDDGSHIGIICLHGGSGWLCLECAVRIMDESS